MKTKITLQDIADSLGISKVTVSRALKGQLGVGDELRKKIETKSAELGYVKSSLQDKNRVVSFAYITPKRFFLKTDHFYTEIYYYLHRVYEKQKSPFCLQVINPRMEKEGEIPHCLQDPTLSGIYVGGELSQEYLKKLKSLKKPVVIIDHFSGIPEFSHVTVDNYYMGYSAAAFLIERGHHQIGFVGKKGVSSNVMDRMMGVRKAMEEHKLIFQDDWIIENHNPQTGQYSIDISLPKKMPTAFICHCDRAAYFLMEKLKSSGYSVPHDISLISFDDTELAQESNPPLTAVKIDRKHFAALAQDEMNRFLGRGDIKGHRTYLETEIIERESVKANRVS